MIKIELNYSLRAHIFEPVYRSILPETFDDSMKIRMVDPMEIFAAKGNALITRAAAGICMIGAICCLRVSLKNSVICLENAIYFI